MLINLSNHPVNKWSQEQLNSAIKKYKSVVDLPFPAISPRATTSQVIKKAERYYNKSLALLRKSNDTHNAVHVMGEFTFVFHLVTLLKINGINAVASTTERIAEELDGKKIVQFRFVKFREY